MALVAGCGSVAGHGGGTGGDCGGHGGQPGHEGLRRGTRGARRRRQGVHAASNGGRRVNARTNLLGGQLSGVASPLLSTGAGAAATSAIVVAIGVWVLGGAKFALRETAVVLGNTSSPQLASTWFSSTYWRVAGIAVLLTLPFLLSVFKSLGIRECLGIDGDYVNTDRLEISQEEFQSFALDTPLKLDRTFDLVVSLEVAEHLPPESARTFIDSLTDLGSVVMFSAAIPLQGGTNHVNEQWPSYWAQLFQERGYVAVDCLRYKIWNNEHVEPWYAQNILIFVRRDCIGHYPLLERELKHTNVSELAMVHPKISQYRLTPRMEAQSPTVRSMYSVSIEVTNPILDILPPSEVDCLRCMIELEGVSLGSIELPVCDGLVPSYVLVDAIAAEFAWSILGKLFQRTVYREIEVRKGLEGVSIWRGALCLADRFADNDRGVSQLIHDQAGWTIFLQELWGRPDWPQARFYEPHPETSSTRRCNNSGWLTVDVTEDVPDLEVSSQELHVVLTVGGSAIGVVTVPVTENTVNASMLRAALTSAGGFELCRTAVREGLLGRPMDEPGSLRTRLVDAASAQRLLHGPALTLGHALSPAQRGTVLGRRANGLIGTTVSRRAVLPAAITQDLVDAASAAGEPVLQVLGPSEDRARLVYAPDLIWQPFGLMKGSAIEASASRVIRAPVVLPYDRGHFEKLFATQPDPWRNTSPYQRAKHEQILELIPSTGIKQALELGCAEGHFTAQLASRVGSLLAARHLPDCTRSCHGTLRRGAERPLCAPRLHEGSACRPLSVDCV